MRGLLGSDRAKDSMVAVAQLVESQIVILVVVGSSPIGHPKSFKQKAQFFELGFLLSEAQGFFYFPEQIRYTLPLR